MRLRIMLASAFLILCLALPVMFAAAYNPLSQVCQQNPDTPTCQQNSKQDGSSANPTVDIIHTAVNILAIVAGVGAVIIIIISGIQFITAGGAAPGQRSGDPNRIKSARATLTSALIGLVIVALAWTIVTFVINNLVKT
jgi:hypothetical protein